MTWSRPISPGDDDAATLRDHAETVVESIGPHTTAQADRRVDRTAP
jgi:hypothetical protein